MPPMFRACTQPESNKQTLVIVTIDLILRILSALVAATKDWRWNLMKPGGSPRPTLADANRVVVAP